MAIYDERLTTHAVWASLAAAHEALDATRDKLADPEQIEEHAHIEAVLNYLQARLNTLDADLAPLAPIDSIHNNLTQLAASLVQFEANPGNRPVLDQADNQAIGILSYLTQLPVTTTVAETENLREIGIRYRRSMSAQVARFSGEVNALSEMVQQVSQAATEQKAQVEAEAGRLDQAVTASNTAFEQAQAAREAEFTQQLTDAALQLKTTLDEAVAAVDTGVKANTDSAAAELAALKQKADAAWEEIAALKLRAETASNYLGINALAGGYSKSADTEDKRAFWLRVGAVACFLGAIAASVFALVYHVYHAFTLDGFLTKAAVAIPFLVLAGYLARESSQHSERANFNRQRQRQLEALPAYVDGLDAERRVTLYEALAPGFFSPVVYEKRRSDTPPPDPAAGAISLLIEELKKRT